MDEKEYAELQIRLINNQLYNESTSLHKKFQFRQFADANKNLMEGQRIRQEDEAGRIEGDFGYNPATARYVLYSFTNGLIHSDCDEPAIQYEGHWEYWNQGMITKVVSDGGKIEEYWENGVPVRIDKSEH